MTVESIYLFNGEKFLEYVDVELFKKTVCEKFDLPDKGVQNFAEFYQDIIELRPKSIINKLLFEHILYGQLKHVYVHKLKSAEAIEINKLTPNLELLIEKYKSVNISVPLQEAMSPNGYNLLDQLNIRKSNVYFIAAINYSVVDDKVDRLRLLIGKTYNDSKLRYMLAGIDIHYSKGECLVLVHNCSTVPKDEDDDDQVSTPTSFHNYIEKKIFPYLFINKYVNVNSDREAMFDFCKGLLDSMFYESREKLMETIEEDTLDFVEKAKIKLDKIGEMSSASHISDLNKNIQSLLLGIYMRNNIHGEKLRSKAKELKLLGYPTKINYKNGRANNSSTGSNSAKKPIYGSETLYSLYTDFNSSKRLEEWSMAWFTDFEGSDLDVIRTRIISKTNYFKVLFAPTRHLDERTVYHVVRELNEKRSF
ncbi:hypothetical protein [Evansella cellulosilytica]|uniref:Uncharacterized protein n=1 Tax=Evansella cellulosilytica (strain ATCC 21833 / DSM 2522 / FERM P-1141 / JCM 9156 / N-4) TaxID=649639 RepID=E6TR40_EVAC2|nr:hypothetical protein [Evansella cellulosilytica]ADU29416.1 hypothetical protein Bcell_1148 [Evansella cellulosilytica DSM 2522]